MPKQKKAASVFLVVCFGLFLFTIMVVTTFHPKDTYSYYENRNLATIPEATTEELLTGKWGSNMDKYLSDHAAGRNTLLKASTYINCHILRQPVVNDVVISKDYLLPEIGNWMLDTSSINSQTAAITQNLSSLSDLVESYGGFYYYVATPCQYVFHSDDYPWFMNNRSDYTEQSISSLSASLQESGVNFIDIGKVFAEHGWADHLSSAIDNHYSIYGAYLTYLEIMERINEDTGYDLTILRDGDYQIQELPNRYLGSRTRKLMGLWPCEERLGILLPNVEVPFTRKNNHNEVAPTVYSLPNNQWENVLYSLYMGGDIALTEIDTMRDELPSILVYGDSFTNAAECILYYGFDKMYSIDMRHYRETTLGEFISEYKPDIVVCIRDYEALLSVDSNGCGA